jgi:hypothetical protein
MPSTNTRNAPPELFANQRLPPKAESKVYEMFKRAGVKMISVFLRL